MTHVADRITIAPVAFTDDVTAMAAYVKSANGRAAIKRGLSDIRAGRIITGRGALAAELKRRAQIRRS